MPGTSLKTPLRKLATLPSSSVNFVPHLIPDLVEEGIFSTSFSSCVTHSVGVGVGEQNFLKHDFIRMLEILSEVVKHSQNLSDFVNGLGEKVILTVTA